MLPHAGGNTWHVQTHAMCFFGQHMQHMPNCQKTHAGGLYFGKAACVGCMCDMPLCWLRRGHGQPGVRASRQKPERFRERRGARVRKPRAAGARGRGRDTGRPRYKHTICRFTPNIVILITTHSHSHGPLFLYGQNHSFIFISPVIWPILTYYCTVCQQIH